MGLRSSRHEKRVASSHAKPVRRPKRLSGAFPLLKLPGELRNAIYSYCRTDSQEVLVHNRRGRRLHDRVGRARLFYSLALAGRQIRKEFLPIYVQGFSHRVRYADVAAYMRAFPADQKLIAGTITIDRTDAQKSTTPAVDFAPLIRLCRKHRGVKVVIAPIDERPDLFSRNAAPRTYRCEMQSLLDYCIEVPTTPEGVKWSHFFDKAVAELWISPVMVSSFPRSYGRFRMVVKSSYSEWWMGWQRAEPRMCLENNNLAMWVKKTGLHASWSLSRLQVCGAR
ncbi:hypothetical protein BKA66DRAFT_570171 [Pyrenochaeta sp. MPI-SDFR-AT-0127]|nr:hypothetical protein BKA66DRAFT_570171 [Pyrenochaeta sp. MPI-SDFR-AT-0127]